MSNLEILLSINNFDGYIELSLNEIVLVDYDEEHYSSVYQVENYDVDKQLLYSYNVNHINN